MQPINSRNKYFKKQVVASKRYLERTPDLNPFQCPGMAWTAYPPETCDGYNIIVIHIANPYVTCRFLFHDQLLIRISKPMLRLFQNLLSCLCSHNADEMSKTLSSILMKCLQPSHLYWWNVYNPLIYADEMFKTLSSMCMQDPSMRTSMCGTSLVRTWSSRSPSPTRAGSPLWPGCPQTSWLLSGMIMLSWLGISSLARLWSDDGLDLKWWW